MRNVAIGGLVAAAAAVLLLVSTMGGEHGWKIALALVGLMLWVVGGLSKQS
jgi:hypothetical protein